MTRRAIELTGTDIVLELSKVTAVRTKQRMLHLDELPDGQPEESVQPAYQRHLQSYKEVV